MRAAVLAALLLLATATSCGSTRHHAATRPVSSWPSPHELDWIRRLGAWSQEISATFSTFDQAWIAAKESGVSGSSPSAERAASAFERCRPSFAREVGAPPSARLEPARHEALSSCRALAAVERDVRGGHAFVFGDLATPVSNAYQRAGYLLLQAIHGAALGPIRPKLTTDDATITHDHVDPRLGRIVSRLARHRIAVYCWAPADAARAKGVIAAISGDRGRDIDVVGWTWVAGNSVNVENSICRRLERLAGEPSRRPTFADADAVRVLTHEAMHAIGDSDEAVTECHAIQRVAVTARLLGVPPANAHTDALLVWRNYGHEPAGYGTRLCHNGGPLDLRLLDPRWP